MTIEEVKRSLISDFNTLENPGLEARVLIKHVLSMTDVDLILKSGDEVGPDDFKKIERMKKERLSGRPSAYITNSREFYGYEFYVDENVLIPQPDTEILVETSLEFLKKKKDPSVLDLCTGSGCIITSLKMEEPYITAHASDLSEKALEIARRNYSANTGEDCDMRQGSLLEPWSDVRFDLIATNPPYVTEKWFEEVDTEVRHEPILALIDHAEDGLDLIREIIETAPEHLNPGAMLIIESDYRQTAEIRRLLTLEGFSGVRTVKDLSGKERSTLGIWN